MTEFVFRPKSPELTAEYGSCSPVKFANMKCTLYDSDGKEIPVPTCKICNKQMSSIIGKESIAWYCYEHGTESNE